MEIKEIHIPGYESVLEVEDKSAHLHAFLAIHNTTLGPALGGVRIWPYKSPEDALDDVLRLAKAMTYKSALCENGLGGGKSVIIANPEAKTEAMLLAFAEALDTLKGKYIAAEDIGSSVEDMAILRKKTPYVAALPSEESSGDPSRFTAHGVLRGIQAVAQELWGSPSLNGQTVAIQGLGHVGAKLAELLFWEGAELILCDINEERATREALQYGAKVIAANEIYQTPCAIFSPCALGGILNSKTIPLLQCQAVAGSANNQLLRSEDGEWLLKRRILYAPDYIINAGGIHNAGSEFDPGGYNPKLSRDKTDKIYSIFLNVFEKSKEEGKSTNKIADELAEYNLTHGIGKRITPIDFSR